MMRGPKKQAIVVRKPDGELAVKESQLKFIKDRYPALGLPLIRGVVTFCASMVEGVKALMFSAESTPRTRRRRRSPPSLTCGWKTTWAAKRPPPSWSPWR